jgi:hypothetical protein
MIREWQVENRQIAFLRLKNISVGYQPVPGTNALPRRKQRHSIPLTAIHAGR